MIISQIKVFLLIVIWLCCYSMSSSIKNSFGSNWWNIRKPVDRTRPLIRSNAISWYVMAGLQSQISRSSSTSFKYLSESVSRNEGKWFKDKTALGIFKQIGHICKQCHYYIDHYTSTCYVYYSDTGRQERVQILRLFVISHYLGGLITCLSRCLRLSCLFWIYQRSNGNNNFFFALE